MSTELLETCTAFK